MLQISKIEKLKNATHIKKIPQIIFLKINKLSDVSYTFWLYIFDCLLIWQWFRITIFGRETLRECSLSAVKGWLKIFNIVNLENFLLTSLLITG